MHEDTSPSLFLLPGTLMAERAAHVVTTVLGSCIAVCLWDPLMGVGGINHYLLPLWNGEGLKTPRFGNIAVPRLIERMEKMGAGKSRMLAKVFGGSSMFSNPRGLIGVGERNIEIAFHQLASVNIPVVAQHVGGTLGRKIIFNTQDGRVLMRPLSGMEARGVETLDPRSPVQFQTVRS